MRVGRREIEESGFIAVGGPRVMVPLGGLVLVRSRRDASGTGIVS